MTAMCYAQVSAFLCKLVSCLLYMVTLDRLPFNRWCSNGFQTEMVADGPSGFPDVLLL